jgi:hypothetical protein
MHLNIELWSVFHLINVTGRTRIFDQVCVQAVVSIHNYVTKYNLVK